jgi:hypothetical protein
LRSTLLSFFAFGDFAVLVPVSYPADQKQEIIIEKREHTEHAEWFFEAETGPFKAVVEGEAGRAVSSFGKYFKHIRYPESHPFGEAGGVAVLGGLVAGPALAVMGFVMGAKASKNLDNAKSNLAEARKIAEELITASILCNGIRRRSYMFERLLIRLDALFLPLIIQMEYDISQTIRQNEAALERKHWIMWRLSRKRRAIWLREAQNIEWGNLESGVQKNFATAASIAKAIKTVIDTPILTEDGKITEESKTIGDSVKLLVDKTES